ncbi:MAG: PilW family protein [Solirubrobacterales bacterium]
MQGPINFRVRSGLGDESGISIIEVLVAELIGGVVLTAAAAVMLISFNSSNRVNDKVNSASQGRGAIELMQQRLRSQTCLFPQEYSINGVLPDSGGQRSFIHANPTKMAFIGDISNANGATNVAGSVGYRPQLRYIWYDPGVTTGKFAGRRGKLMEGSRSTSNSSIPFNFSLSPLTGVTALDQMATVGNVNQVNPSESTPMAEGVTNEVGPGNVPIPFFRYYDAAGAELPQSSGAVISSALSNVNRVNVTFRILAASGKDSIQNGGVQQDTRTASYSTDVYVRVGVDGCN